MKNLNLETILELKKLRDKYLLLSKDLKDLKHEDFDKIMDNMDLIDDNLEYINILDSIPEADLNRKFLITEFNPESGQQDDFINRMYDLGFVLLSVTSMTRYKGYLYFKNNNI